MEPILQIKARRSDDENLLCYRITATQGAEVISSSEILREYLKGTVPQQKGIVDVSRISSDIWEIKTNK